MKNKLTQAARSLIKEEIDYLELTKAINDLKTVFEDVSEINFNDPSIDENIFLKTGKAIGPKWAGMCLQDLMRTKMFIKGVYKAIKEVRKNKKDTPVTILYAGTGPYATLIMPLTTLFKPSELQLILLEINPISFRNLKNTIHKLNVSDYIKEIHLCDASTFKPTPNQHVDIVLIECLQHALVKEPQVAITYNLLSHLDKDVILIPEQISLQISVIDSAKKIKYLKEITNTKRLDFYKNLETIFMLNKEEVLKNPSLTFPKVEVLFSEEKNKDFTQLAITTDLTIFNNEKLIIDDSGLTIPLIISNLDNENIKGIVTQYMVSESPGLEFSLIR